MSGYESIRDWAFDNYDFNDYDTFQDWLDAIESDFDLNGRGIPLRKIFDNQDYIDLENEWNERKGIEEEEEEEIDIEEIEDIEKEKIDFIEEEENIIEEFVREKFVEPIVKTVNRIRGFFGL
jgi:hypothetical protein